MIVWCRVSFWMVNVSRPARLDALRNCDTCSKQRSVCRTTRSGRNPAGHALPSSLWVVSLTFPCIPLHAPGPEAPPQPRRNRFCPYYICLCFYVIRSFLPSLPGGRRHTDLGIKTPPDSWKWWRRPTAACQTCELHHMAVLLRPRCATVIMAPTRTFCRC